MPRSPLPLPLEILLRRFLLHLRSDRARKSARSAFSACAPPPPPPPRQPFPRRLDEVTKEKKERSVFVTWRRSAPAPWRVALRRRRKGKERRRDPSFLLVPEVCRFQGADPVENRSGGAESRRAAAAAAAAAMSAFDTNPFADPVDVNPFQDPSVTQLAHANQGGLDEFNPFSESSRLTNVAQTVPAAQPTGPSQPAVLQPSVEPTPQAVASAAQAGLLQQQEELERKAAELDRKERELQNSAAGFNPKQNNWPPLPKSCPVKPCFYQDFSADIPADYQRTCKMLYYLWMFHSVTLLLNLLACLAWFTDRGERGVDFGLSILWFVIFTPCAFLCWYRPVYKAFRSDSSFSFFVFFFVFFCQIAIYIIQTVGIPNWGVSGWIAALSEIGHNLAVSIIMMVVAVFFTVCSILSLFLLKQVHSQYRRTGASFQRAQEEFSQGILTNRTVQNAAAGAASTAAQSAFRGN